MQKKNKEKRNRTYYHGKSPNLWDYVFLQRQSETEIKRNNGNTKQPENNQ